MSEDLRDRWGIEDFEGAAGGAAIKHLNFIVYGFYLKQVSNFMYITEIREIS